LEAGWEVGVGSDFSIDFDETLCEDGSDFTLVQGILETIPDINECTLEGGRYLRKRINGSDSRPL
jgi:hypothetical protein